MNIFKELPYREERTMEMETVNYMFCVKCDKTIEKKHLLNEPNCYPIPEDFELIHKKCNTKIEMRKNYILHEKKFNTETDNHSLERNCSCHTHLTRGHENSRIVSHDEFLDEDGYGFSDPFVIHNGSNFHATLSMEGLYPETYGSKSYTQLIDLDQNMPLGEFPMKQGQIFIRNDWDWSECLNAGHEENPECDCKYDRVPRATEYVYISHAEHDLYGRKQTYISYIDVDRWFGRDMIKYETEDHKIPNPYMTNTMKEIQNDMSLNPTESVIVQHGKFVPAFRYNPNSYEITNRFFDFKGRETFLQELKDYEKEREIQAEKEFQKECKKIEKELAQEQQTGLECFF